MNEVWLVGVTEHVERRVNEGSRPRKHACRGKWRRGIDKGPHAGMDANTTSRAI